jgi:hypothetical protein
MEKSTCLRMFSAGINYCPEKAQFTRGFVSSTDCVDYEVRTSYSTTDGQSPWDLQRPSFPPPEDLESKPL